jgi:hypothetical protein
MGAIRTLDYSVRQEWRSECELEWEATEQAGEKDARWDVKGTGNRLG